MKIEVLYIAECPNHMPVVERVRDVLCAAGIGDTVMEVEVLNNLEAEQWRFFGSPTVRINGLDVEPEARTAQHFGLGCRSYPENGHRSGMPSRELIRRAVQEHLGTSPSLPNSTSVFTAQPPASTVGRESSFLAVGGLSAMLASTCCLGPLILVALGFSGAWIGNLAALEPYRPWFIGAALIALFFAGRRIFRKPETCAPGQVCSLPTTRGAYKAIFGLVTALVVVAFILPYLARFFY